MIVSRYVPGNVDEVTGGKIPDVAGKRGALRARAREFVEPWLDDGQLAGGDVAHTGRVGVVAHDMKTFGGDCQRRDEAKMGQSGKADHRRAHCCACTIAAWPSPRSSRFNRMSFDKSVSRLPAQ